MKDAITPLLCVGLDDLTHENLDKGTKDAKGGTIEPIVIVDDSFTLSARLAIGILPSGVDALLVAASLAFEEGKAIRDFEGMIDLTDGYIEVDLEELAQAFALVQPRQSRKIPFAGTLSQNPRAHVKAASSKVKSWQQRLPPRTKTRRGA